VTFREVPQSSPEEKDGYCEVDIKSGDLRALLKVRFDMFKVGPGLHTDAPVGNYWGLSRTELGG
jgi:hypothetical protein